MSIGQNWSPVLMIRPEDYETPEEYLLAVQTAYDQWSHTRSPQTQALIGFGGYQGNVDPANPGLGGYVGTRHGKNSDTFNARANVRPHEAIDAYLAQNDTGGQALPSDAALAIEQALGRDVFEAVAEGALLTIIEYVPDGQGGFHERVRTQNPDGSWTVTGVTDGKAAVARNVIATMPDGTQYDVTHKDKAWHNRNVPELDLLDWDERVIEDALTDPPGDTGISEERRQEIEEAKRRHDEYVEGAHTPEDWVVWQEKGQDGNMYYVITRANGATYQIPVEAGLAIAREHGYNTLEDFSNAVGPEALEAAIIAYDETLLGVGPGNELPPTTHDVPAPPPAAPPAQTSPPPAPAPAAPPPAAPPATAPTPQPPAGQGFNEFGTGTEGGTAGAPANVPSPPPLQPSVGGFTETSHQLMSAPAAQPPAPGPGYTWDPVTGGWYFTGQKSTPGWAGRGWV